MLELGKLTREVVAKEWHCGGRDTVEDKLAISAINKHDLDPTDRQKHVVHWLDYYKVLMFMPADRRNALADQIIGFADEPRKSLHGDKDRIVSEFNRLMERISKVAPQRKSGKPHELTSLTSKALWCCYPDDVPIFDRNAACALRVISRLCHLVPEPKQPEYACFVGLWLQVYNEIEPVISQEDLFDCPYKVRVLDRLLWYLGQESFYDVSVGSRAI
jgi:hypothetical protein